jgi:hypothetical protein
MVKERNEARAAMAEAGGVMIDGLSRKAVSLLLERFEERLRKIQSERDAAGADRDRALRRIDELAMRNRELTACRRDSASASANF